MSTRFEMINATCLTIKKEPSHWRIEALCDHSCPLNVHLRVR